MFHVLKILKSILNIQYKVQNITNQIYGRRQVQDCKRGNIWRYVVKILKSWLKNPILAPDKLQISSRMFFKAHYLYAIYQRNREHLKSGQREKNIHVKRGKATSEFSAKIGK